MTRQRDIGRVLDEWLAPGPIEAPDRILDVLADRIATTPQRRFPRAHERFRPVTPFFKLLAAATLAIAVGVSVGPLAAPPNQVDSPSPAPSPSPIALGDTGLRFSWNRLTPPGSGPGGRIEVQFTDEDSMIIDSTDGGRSLYLQQRVSIPTQGRLELSRSAGLGGCAVAEDAIYRWQLSPRGSRLTLAAVSDGCPQRAAIVPGDYVRDSCAAVAQACVGSLDAGSYFSTQFAPGPDAAPTVGGLTYDVPDGWHSDEEYAAHYSLLPDASIEARLADPSAAVAQILVFARPYAASQTEDCSDPRDATVGHTIPDLIAWLQRHPGLTTAPPVDIAIGDFAGVSIDIDIDPAWTATCAGYPSPVVALFRTGPGGWESTWEVGGVGTERDPTRVILLQVAEDLVTAVLVYPGATSTPEEFYPMAMPIVESMRFRP